MRLGPHLPEQSAIAGAVVLTVTAFWTSGADPLNVVKLTLLVWAAVAAVACVAVRAVVTRTLAVPWGSAAAVTLPLTLALALASVTAPVGTTAVVGTPGRNSGLLAYLAAVVLFLVGLLCLERGRQLAVPVAVLIAGAFTASYGLLQQLGVDAVAWEIAYTPIIAALGNPDFASAVMGITVPVAAWFALRTDLPTPWRVALFGLALLIFGVAVASRAIQGPLAAAAGIWVLLLAGSLNLDPARRRFCTRGLAAAAVGAVGAAVVGARGLGPLAGEFTGPNYEARSLYWRSALQMLTDRPWTGVGMDAYGSYFRQVRVTQARDPGAFGTVTDAAHSVPLQMAAQGGVPLGLAYLAFVLTVAAALVIGLVRLSGAARLQVGGLGGAWVAAQTQSWVSIDQVPLLTLQFVLGAAVVVASGVRCRRDVPAPAPPVAVENVGRGRRRPPPVEAPRLLGPPTYAAVSLVGVLAVLAGWFASTPLRADLASGQAATLRAQGRVSDAVPGQLRAASLLPGSSLYWSKAADARNAMGDTGGAFAALVRATESDPFDFDAWANAARLAEALGRIDQAGRLYRRALVIDPVNEGALSDFTQYALATGQAQEAGSALERAVDVRPDTAPLWVLLGQVHAELGESTEARTAFERALALQPGSTDASDGLRKLDAARPQPGP